MFSPRESVGLKVLTTAAQRFEELTGQEVDIEEGAIASAFKRLVAQEREALMPVLARARGRIDFLSKPFSRNLLPPWKDSLRARATTASEASLSKARL